MRVHVLGVRGSTPAPGREFVRYGGHTSCLALARDGEAPKLILDAGTGIRRVAALIGGRPFKGSVLLGHMHWDHTQGLPFFTAGDDPGSTVALYAPVQRPEEIGAVLPQEGASGPVGKVGPSATDIEAVLARAMSPPHFPISPAGLRGLWHFFGLQPGEFEVEGFSVLALDIPHKGGRTFGYRISDGKSVLCYMSDHCPTTFGAGPAGLGEYHPSALALAAGSDILFHDGQYLDEELLVRASLGHSCAGYAIGLAKASGARRLALFHHDPPRTDNEIDAIVASEASRARAGGVALSAAAEGTVIEL